MFMNDDVVEKDTDNSPWRKANDQFKVKKLKSQKRALQERLFDCESPKKKSKQTLPNGPRNLGVKRSVHLTLPQDSTCDDSTLMDLLGLRPIPGENVPASHLDFSMLLSSPSKFNYAVHTSPVKPIPQPEQRRPLPSRALTSTAATSSTFSPLKSFVTELKEDAMSSPSKDSRKTLVPRRLPLSPSFSPKSKSKSMGVKPLNDLPPPTDGGPDWHRDLCLDWSLKFGCNIISPNSYGWSSNNLKTSEESSGISAFVRCIDIEPGNPVHPSCPSTGSSQLDTSLGAQFHQCCLYWQHPSIPTVTLFPRELSNKTGQKSANTKPSIRFDKTTVDSMHLEWVEAFRSAFQLLKARQCPFFYICMNNITCLFCSAGTQGDEQTHIYISPGTKALKMALNAQKIQYSLPYCKEESSDGLDDADSCILDGSDGEGELEEWEKGLEDGGVIPEARLPRKKRPIIPSVNDPKLPTLILISGSETLSFFNFLINSKSLLITNIGPFAGLPPTILSPVAFHGATLRTLQVEQRKVNVDSMVLHSIDMKGPILPHVLHMLTSLLNKTVKSYKLKVKTLESTTPLNLYSNMNQVQRRVKPSAFDLQNLSDCGLKKGILEVFCRCDNCDTILQMLEGKRGMYRWK